MDTNTTVAAPPAAPPPAAGGAAPPAAAVPAAAPASAIASAVEPAAPAKGEKPAEGEKPKEAAKAIELALPKGFEADAKTLDAFKATATELGLDSPKAQKLFDQYVALEQSRTEAAEKAFTAQDAKWTAELKADPEFAGPKWDGAMKDVRRALKQFGGNEAAQLLHQAGLGNHPLLVKAFAAIGRAMADDTISGTQTPAPPAGERLTDAQVFYGKPTTSSAKDD